MPENKSASSSMDFHQFYENEEFSDIVIVVQDHQFPAHRMILAKWSPVFYKMLSVPMAESETRKILLVDKSVESVQMFIKYLYCPSGRYISNENVKGLLELGHEFDVIEIVSACEIFLISKVNLQTAGEYLPIAAQYGLADLTKSCDSHLAKQKFDTATVFQHLAIADQYALPAYTKACIEYAAVHAQDIIHPQIYLLSSQNVVTYLQGYKGSTCEKVDIIEAWVKHENGGVRVCDLLKICSDVLSLNVAGHLLSSEVLDRIKALDFDVCGGAWTVVQADLNEWLVVAWRQKFKTLETSANDLESRINKVRLLIDDHQKIPVCSVFRPSMEWDKTGLDNAATHNYKLLEWTNVLNS